MSLLFLIAPVCQAAAAERDLLLAVELNGKSLEIVVQAVDRDNTLLIERDDFAAIGLRMPPDPSGGDGPPNKMAPLGAVDGLSYRIDEKRQMLLLMAGDTALLPHVIGAPAATATRPPDEAAYGAILNYDLFGSFGSSRNLAGLFDGTLNTPYGDLNNSFLAQSAATATQQLVRLDTSFVQADQARERVWQVGDLVSGGLPWTRPFRLGGAQVRSDFTLRPDLVTYPVPAIGGHAAVTSSIDVLVNGARQFSEDVQSGPFAIHQPPGVTGAGEITVVTRDVFGQQSVQTIPFYISTALLAAGVTAYSAETGILRTNYAKITDKYAGSAGSLSIRHGVRDWLTAEMHAEATGGVQMAGGGLAFNAHGLGIVTLSAATSHGAKGPAIGQPAAGIGSLYAAGFEHAGRIFSVAASITASDRRFRDVPAAVGDAFARQIVRVSLGLTFSIGTLRAGYVGTRGGTASVPSPVPTLPGGSASIGTLTYSRPIGDRASFYATAYRDFAQRNSAAIVCGVSMMFGPRRTASLLATAANAQSSGALDVAQSAFQPGEFGFRGHASSDPRDSQSGEVSYLSNFGDARIGTEHLTTQTNGRAELLGAVVVAGGRAFAARRITDSYAIIDTQGQPDVPVLLENRLAGYTDAGGRLLLGGLHGWTDNRISIDPTKLPADVESDTLTRVVRPRAHGGLVVQFPVHRGSSAVIRIVDRPGHPVPAGSVATVKRSGKRAIVGFDGEVFATDLQNDETLSVRMPTGSCTAHFKFHPKPGEIPLIGPITCVP